MKRALSTITLVATAMFLVSCSTDPVESQPDDADSHASHSVSNEPDEALDGLGLNDGNKWLMDDHTRASFAKMATSFLNADHLSLEGEGLMKAGADLQDDLDDLIQGCTMTGNAHNQLHVYLTGYIPAVAALSESGQIEDARKVAHYLEIYGNYFE